MQKVVFLIGLIVAFFVFDAIAFHGYYGDTSWRWAKEQGLRFNYEMQYWLRRFK